MAEEKYSLLPLTTSLKYMYNIQIEYKLIFHWKVRIFLEYIHVMNRNIEKNIYIYIYINICVSRCEFRSYRIRPTEEKYKIYSLR